MPLDEKVSKQANVNCQLCYDAEVKLRACPIQRINPVFVEQNKNVNIEQNEVSKDCPEEYKSKIDFLSVLVLSEKKFG